MSFEPGNTERLEKLKDSFFRALGYPSAERSEVMAPLRAEDPELYYEVLRLIGEQELAGDFLAPPTPCPPCSPGGGAAQEPLFAPGEQVCGRYRVIRLIGSGGMGEVYEAQDPNFERRVALKTVRLDRALDSRMQERLRREAVLASQITHPNVCRVLDLVWHETATRQRVGVLTMAYVAGPTIAEVLNERGRLPPTEALPMILQMAAALQASHEAGVVHRDFKPSNVILCGSRLVVTDFGLAVPGVRTRGETLTSLSGIAGTPEYMAPEQLETGDTSARSDIYSLGVVIYEMVTGVRPTTGSTGIAELLKRLLEPIPSPRSISRDIPVRWERTILKALERDPKRRYATAGELVTDLTSHSLLLPHPSRRTVLGGIGALAAVSLSVAGIRYWNWRVQVPPGTYCMITPIGNTTADSRLSGFTLLLRQQMQQSSRLQPWDPGRLPQALALMRKTNIPEPGVDPAAWRELAMREGVPLLCFGSITAVAEEFVLNMRLELTGKSPAAPGRHWPRTFRAASLPLLLDLSRDVVNWMRELTGEVGEAINERSRPPAALTSGSWDALALYAQADEIARTEPERAIPLLREAVRIDPDFTLAHLRLGDALVTLRRWEEGLPSWETALSSARRQSLSEREELHLQTRYSIEIGDYPAGEAAALRWSGAFPADNLPYWLLSSVRYTMGNNNGAIEALRHITTSTSEGRRLRVFAEARQDLESGDGANLAASAKAMEEMGEAENSARFEGIAHVLAGDHGGAEAAFQRLAQLPSSASRSRGQLLLSVLDSSRGRIDQADRRLADAIHEDQRNGDSTFRAVKLMARAYLAWIRSDLVATRSLAMEAQSVAGDPDIHVQVAILLCRSGARDDASRVLQRLKLPDRYPRFRVLHQLAQAEALLSAGKAADAVALIEDATRHRPYGRAPESMLYALWRSGDRVRFQSLAGEALRHPAFTWNSPEQQFGPVSLLINKLTH